MELKTHALDRVIEALSPTLAVEIERVVQETRESMEQEFQSRLDAALREAETAAAGAVEPQIRQAVAEASETVRQQVREELSQQFKEQLNAATAQLEIEAAADRARLQKEIEQWRAYAEAHRELSGATSQPEILSRFLRLAEPFSEGLAVYVAKPSGLGLWKSRGERTFPDTISNDGRDPAFYFRMIVVRGRPVAALYAPQPFMADALEHLAVSLEHAIEMFGLRLREPALKSAAASVAEGAVDVRT